MYLEIRAYIQRLNAVTAEKERIGAELDIAAKIQASMGRLQRVLAKNAQQAPQEVLRAVKRDIDAFVGQAPQFDDITMLCLRYQGEEENA